MRLFSLMMTVAFVAACTPGPGAVSQFNGDSVTISQDTTWQIGGRTDETDAEANRICAKAGKTAEYASSRQLLGYVHENFYLCV